MEELLDGVEGPFISASDYVRALGEQLTPWIPGDYYVLGTDGMGRSETREALRRHFEVDAESITIAALSRLAKAGVLTPKDVQRPSENLATMPRNPIPILREPILLEGGRPTQTRSCSLLEHRLPPKHFTANCQSEWLPK